MYLHRPHHTQSLALRRNRYYPCISAEHPFRIPASSPLRASMSADRTPFNPRNSVYYHYPAALRGPFGIAPPVSWPTSAVCRVKFNSKLSAKTCFSNSLDRMPTAVLTNLLHPLPGGPRSPNPQQPADIAHPEAVDSATRLRKPILWSGCGTHVCPRSSPPPTSVLVLASRRIQDWETERAAFDGQSCEPLSPHYRDT